MNREFFKTAILNILVFLSLVLAFNIWFDKELWDIEELDDYSNNKIPYIRNKYVRKKVM